MVFTFPSTVEGNIMESDSVKEAWDWKLGFQMEGLRVAHTRQRDSCFEGVNPSTILYDTFHSGTATTSNVRQGRHSLYKSVTLSRIPVKGN